MAYHKTQTESLA